MALKSKVLNVGEETFEAEVNGTKYKIKAGDGITVNRRTAIALRGVYTPKERKVSLKIEHLPGEVNIHACHFCGVEFPAKDILDRHLKTHSANVVAENTVKETEKIYIAPDGQEFKSKAALLSHLRAAATPKDK